MNNSLSRLLRLLRRRRLPDFKVHLKRARKNWRQRSWRSMDMISIVSQRPAVLLTGCHPRKLSFYLQRPLRDLDLTIFYRAGWSLEHEPTFLDRVAAIKAAQQKFPRHRYIFAANTPHEVELLKAADIRAEFLNENAFIDEYSFQPDPTVAKEFDAVLDAQIAAYKRLELAAEVRSLLALTYVMEERYNADYGNMIRRTLSHAHWANGPYWEAGYRKLKRPEIAATYRKARVGLCLSELEGANLASIQYLLSGLAVVSTESRGGRDIFFAPEYARIVAAEPTAVASAVSELVRDAPPPAVVRERTLEKIRSIRDRFGELLTAECGHAAVDEGWWKEFNARRPICYQDVSKIAKILAEANRRR